MNKKKTKEKVQIISVFLFFCVLLGTLWLVLPRPVSHEVAAVQQLLREDGHVIHAGGFLSTEDGETVSYTNSMEALEHLYRDGNRICEIDIQETVDGMLICGHGDEKELVFGTGLPPAATGEEFLKSRIYGEFTPVSFRDLAAFLRSHPDLLVITDVKTDNLRACTRMMEEAADIQNQLLVQIQLPEEYDTIRSLGFQNILYPIFRTPDQQRDLIHLRSFAKHHELVALILPNGYYSPDWKLFLAERIIGVPFVLHTLNDDWEMSYYLNHHLALAVYTDRTVF